MTVTLSAAKGLVPWLQQRTRCFAGPLRNYETLRYAAQERPERLERSGRLIPFLLVSLAAPAARNSG